MTSEGSDHAGTATNTQAHTQTIEQPHGLLPLMRPDPWSPGLIWALIIGIILCPWLVRAIWRMWQIIRTCSLLRQDLTSWQQAFCDNPTGAKNRLATMLSSIGT